MGVGGSKSSAVWSEAPRNSVPNVHATSQLARKRCRRGGITEILLVHIRKRAMGQEPLSRQHTERITASTITRTASQITVLSNPPKNEKGALGQSPLRMQSTESTKSTKAQKHPPGSRFTMVQHKKRGPGGQRKNALQTVVHGR